MFILVKYGDNETLICNPTCAAVNLLSSIKDRSGHPTITVDLSDEKGLIQELDFHRLEYASDYLALQSTYVLVEKVTSPAAASAADADQDTSDRPPPPHPPANCDYVPLLNNYKELYPNLKLHVQTAEKGRTKNRENKLSLSPAGVKVAKAMKKIPQKVAAKKR